MPAATRTLAVLSRDPHCTAAVVRLTVGKNAAAYTFARDGAGWDVAPVRPGDGYRVEGGRCSCPAGRHGKACKHRDGVTKLIDLNVLAGCPTPGAGRATGPQTPVRRTPRW